MFFPAVLCLLPAGDCHLTVWSTWSTCQLTCLEGRSFETTGRHARSRAVIIQVLENKGSCPHEVYESRPCKGTERNKAEPFISIRPEHLLQAAIIKNDIPTQTTWIQWKGVIIWSLFSLTGHLFVMIPANKSCNYQTDRRQQCFRAKASTS